MSVSRMNLFKDSFKNILVNDLAREYAIVIYEDKLYKDSNHTEALELALNAHGKTLGLNLQTGELLPAERITKSYHGDGVIYTWNLYSDENNYYMIATSSDDLEKSLLNKDLQKMVEKYKAKIGYFYSYDKIELVN